MSHINCSSCGVSFELGIPYSSGSICPDCNYVVHCSGCFRDFPVHQLKDGDGVLFCSDCLNLAAAPVPDSALASSGVAAPVPASIIPFLVLPEGFDPVNSYLDFIELMHLVHVRKISYHKVAVTLFQGNSLADMTVHQIVSAVYAAVNKGQSK